jgi:hypothetical protein
MQLKESKLLLMPTKIKTSISDEVMFISNRKCVVCQKPGHHIHHIDGNNSNNGFDNLALLCFSHHDLASIRGGLSRKLSPGEIKKYRALHYKRVAHDRKLKSDPKYRSLKNFDFLYELCLDANVAIEVGKLKNNLDSSNWDLTETTLPGLYAFPYNIGTRGRQAILEALEEISSRTRDQIPINVALSITNLVTHIVPSKRKKERVDVNELNLYELGITTGFNIVYDGIKYLKSEKHALRGLELIYRVARYSGFNKKVLNAALRDSDRLLDMSKSFSKMNRLIYVFKTAIETERNDYPDLPDEFDNLF